MGAVRILVLGVAVVAAIGAVIITRSMLSNTSPAAVQVVKADTTVMSKVLVAAQTVKRGERLDGGALAWREWPEKAITSAMVSQRKAGDAMERFETAIARGVIIEGEPISEEKVVFSDNQSYLAALIEPGKRAVSVQISAYSAAGGFILPGDDVDVILTHKEERATADGTSRDILRAETILRKVTVLGIDQQVETEEDKTAIVAKTATLELGPRQAEVIAMAQRMGDISLALRSLETPDAMLADADTWGEGASQQILIRRYGNLQTENVGAN